MLVLPWRGPQRDLEILLGALNSRAIGLQPAGIGSCRRSALEAQDELM